MIICQRRNWLTGWLVLDSLLSEHGVLNGREASRWEGAGLARPKHLSVTACAPSWPGNSREEGKGSLAGPREATPPQLPLLGVVGLEVPA